MTRLGAVLIGGFVLSTAACGGGEPSVPAATSPATSSPAAGTAASPSAGLGTVTFENSGAPAAQADFLRGVAWLHSFGYEDAIEAFRAAQKADPDFALAYWGEAMSYSQPLWFFEEPEKGRAVLARLGATPEARVARGRTERERGYLRAVEALWGAGDRLQRLAAYRDAMAAVSAANPNDDEARVFHALGLLAAMPLGDGSLPMREQAGRLAEAVFARNPQHPGAAHLILHAYDHATLAPRGLEAARAYARIAPAASHALHMPAHFFVQLGHWADAAASDQASWDASVAWVARGNRTVVQRDFHSLTWLQYELTQLGRFAEAQRVATEIDAALAIATAADVIGGHIYADSEIGRGSGPAALRNDKGSMRARYVIESERWTEMRGQQSFDNLDELFVLGVSALRRREDAPVAIAVRGELQKASAPGMDPGLREQASILLLELEAIAALGDGIPGVAFSKMDEAAALQAKMPKPIGRPFPVKGADELYGELLLEAGRPAEAVPWFERTLVRTPNRSRAVLGLARALTRAGQAARGRAAYAQFLDNWKRADEGLPELAEARAAVAPSR
jgi:tetratricopeptide (TPR) repeat protein